MTGWRRLGACLAASVGVLVGAVVTPLPAHADASISVSGLRQEPGLVEFYLTARNLIGGDSLDATSVTVQVEETSLPVRDVRQVATFGEEADNPRRLAVLVVDISGSMAGQPMIDAVAAASRYVSQVPDDVELAVVTVSTQAETRLAPTLDRASVEQTLNSLFAGGETALYDGLAAAAALADDPEYAESRVLVLSDGADNTSFTTLAAAQQRLLEAGATTDTVAFRTDQSVTDLLVQIAEDLGGRSYEAEGATDLTAAFEQAARAFTVRVLVTVEVPPELSGSDTQLEVTVAADGQTARTSVPVVLALDPNAPGALTTVPSGRLSLLTEGGLVVLIFAGFLALGLVIFAPLLDRRRRNRMVAQVEQFAMARTAQPPPDAEEGGRVAQAALALSERVVQAQGMEGKIALKLDRAGMRLRPHEWLLLRALTCLVLVLLLALFIGPLFGALLGLLMGWTATELYQRRKIERRVQAFADLFPDALQLVIGSLRSGFSLSQAIDAMVREFPDPIASEFGRALGETRLGGQLEDALDRVAKRMNNPDLGWAVVAIRVQQQVGGNLAEVLSTTVKTIRERNSLRRHVRALSAEGRLSAWILVALPLIMAFFIFTFRTEYARPLVTHPVGLLMLAVGVLLMVVGTIWMARVVKVEI
jgi:Flp pilus assembly protein TadB/Mg-chelatase subunit ChlD